MRRLVEPKILSCTKHLLCIKDIVLVKLNIEAVIVAVHELRFVVALASLLVLEYLDQRS